MLATSALKDLRMIEMQAWIDAHGGDSASFHFIELPSAATIASIERGRLDGGYLQVPYIDEAVASKRIRVLGYAGDAVANRYLITGWVALAEYLAANKQVVGHFADAITRASRYANSHGSEMVPLIAAYIKQEPEVVMKSKRTSLGTTVDPKDLQPMIDLAAKYGAVPEPFSAHDIIADGYA
jgi:ABC-type nitrate/sulfonate/bicarbonate transport system substrate-binding protein